ncbi:MAG: hypothetical protein DRN91_00055 [Candidatus Alkanophagales archaeon]|nr:MAG: hypothetical protein DRN91_00055 [Candidatus Alkanophagales archaeon]
MDVKVIKQMFGSPTHVKTILLFYNGGSYFDNITGLTKALGKSHVTVRKVVSDLLKAGILKEVTVGRSRVIKINEDSPYTKALFEFLDKIKEIEEGKTEKDRIKTLIERRAAKQGESSKNANNRNNSIKIRDLKRWV